MDNAGRAYGAGLAGGSFDPVTFIKKPTVILRLVSWAFAIIVFACISNVWYRPVALAPVECGYDQDSGACGFGTFTGVMAFLSCMIFLGVDAYFDNISSVQLRKQLVLADLVSSGIWAFFYFVSFCYLTSKWNSTPSDQVKLLESKSAAEAPIAFAFFSIFTFGGLTFFAFRRYREGSANAFAPPYESDIPGGVPHGFGGTGGGDFGQPQSYQEAPFSATNENVSGGPQYQQPAY